MICDNMMKLKANYVHFPEEILGDEPLSGHLWHWPRLQQAWWWKVHTHKPYSQGQEGHLKRTAEVRWMLLQWQIRGCRFSSRRMQHPGGTDVPQGADTPLDETDNVTANCHVLQSLIVPRRFREWLAGYWGFFLHYLRGHH